MSQPSSWPLPSDGKRFLLPKALINRLAQHPLSSGLYPQALGFYPVAHQHVMERRDHDDFLFLYCTAGIGWLRVEDQQPVQVVQGDVVVIPQGVAHHYWADPRRPWTLYWLHFAGTQASHFVDWLAAPSWVRPLGLNAKVLSAFDTLFELRSRGSQWSAALHACHQLQQLLSYVALVLDRQPLGQGRNLNVESVKAHMMEKLHGQLNLDELAAETHLSKYHFAKCFKAQTGQSPIHSFIELKIQHACYLLDSSRLSVKQVALKLGYEDAYYFSRLFKKVMGVSPLQYRAGLQRQSV